MTFHSGRTGTTTVSGNELPTVSWRVNPSVELQRFRNSKTGRFTLLETTFFACTGEVAIDTDFDAMPFAAPYNIVVGQTLSTTKLIENGGTGGTQYFSFPSIVVTSTPVEVVIDGRLAMSFTFEASGTYSYPGGITPS